jgi:hypothetical protein
MFFATLSYLVLFLQKNRLAMEIMRLTFRMDLLVTQALNGVIHNLTPTQTQEIQSDL